MEHAMIVKRAILVVLAVLLGMGALMGATGCSQAGAAGAGSKADNSKPLTVVWLPDSSSSDMTTSREAVASVIKEATGRDVDLMTTTDYNVAIEALVSGKADMGMLGPEGYVQANSKNPHVQAAFTTSDKNGSLDEACYYSRICVPADQADQYKSGDTYSIDNIKGKSFSFVSATSTSGCKIPSNVIKSHFNLDSTDEVTKDGGFFSSVMYGNSHQGSAVNLLAGNCDVAAFDDESLNPYTDLVSGQANTVGATYQVKENMSAPFDQLAGKKFTIISVTPVMNSPFVYNTDNVSEDEQKAITDAFCSQETAQNSEIFVDPSTGKKGLVEKTSDKMCFLPVDDAWYDPIRQLA
ncbi:MAG: phosphate/phosphite/phosphonate ABC transporter substrate-binding protein [Eggerthellaceae bacterium]